MDRIAVVDNDTDFVNTALGYVRRFSEENGMDVQASVFSTAEDFLAGYDGSYFAVFIETELEGMDGIEAVRRLRIADGSVPVIFISHEISYAPLGYGVKALGYLVKPISYHAFISKLETARGLRDSSRDLPVVIRLKDRNEVVRMSEVYYVESMSRMVIYHTARGDFSVRKTMSETEKELSGGSFASCGQSFLVNLEHVQTIEPRFVTVHGDKIPLSRTREKEFMNSFDRYIEQSRRFSA